MLEKVKETVAEALGADIDTITCGVEIPTEDLETMVTVGDVAEYLEQHKN